MNNPKTKRRSKPGPADMDMIEALRNQGYDYLRNLARDIHVSDSTLYDMFKKGKIKGAKVGQYVLARKDTVEEAIAELRAAQAAGKRLPVGKRRRLAVQAVVAPSDLGNLDTLRRLIRVDLRAVLDEWAEEVGLVGGGASAGSNGTSAAHQANGDDDDTDT